MNELPDFKTALVDGLHASFPHHDFDTMTIYDPWNFVARTHVTVDGNPIPVYVTPELMQDIYAFQSDVVSKVVEVLKESVGLYLQFGITLQLKQGAFTRPDTFDQEALEKKFDEFPELGGRRYLSGRPDDVLLHPNLQLDKVVTPTFLLFWVEPVKV